MVYVPIRKLSNENSEEILENSEEIYAHDYINQFYRLLNPN